MSDAMLVSITNGSLRYKNGHVNNNEPLVFSNINIHFPQNKWTAILGKSGCGKSTLLRLLAGLLNDDVDWSGSIQCSLEDSLDNSVAYMAQEDLLMPWLNVMDNVCLGRKFVRQSSIGKSSIQKSSVRQMFSRKSVTEEDEQRALFLLEKVGLLKQRFHFPNTLSGGMRQRVALARTLMQDKPLVLMDEPFSALDAVTRHQLQTLSAQLLQNKTVILITHDPQEALILSDQILLMQGSPAQAIPFNTPAGSPPRSLTGEIASLQQSLIDTLEKDYV